MKASARDGRGGFTLLELLITVVVVGVVLVVATPSIKRYLEAQRLRSVGGELLNDLQFARTEAVAQKRMIGIRLNSDGTRTCYTVAAFRGASCLSPAPGDSMSSCNCLSGAGSACTAGGTWDEIKTVTVPASEGVSVNPPPGIYNMIGFDPTSGNISYCTVNMTGLVPPAFTISTDSSSSGALKTQVTPAGRPRTCAAPGIAIPGVPSC